MDWSFVCSWRLRQSVIRFELVLLLVEARDTPKRLRPLRSGERLLETTMCWAVEEPRLSVLATRALPFAYPGKGALH